MDKEATPTKAAEKTTKEAVKPVAKKKMGKSFGVASMVLGIVSILLCWQVWLAIICAILALIFGIIALVKKADGKGLSITGVITGGVGLLASIIICIVAITAANVFVDTVEEVIDTRSDVIESIEEEAIEGLEAWSEEVDACLEANGINPEMDVEDMTEAQQNIYWDCL